MCVLSLSHHRRESEGRDEAVLFVCRFVRLRWLPLGVRPQNSHHPHKSFSIYLKNWSELGVTDPRRAEGAIAVAHCCRAFGAKSLFICLTEAIHINQHFMHGKCCFANCKPSVIIVLITNTITNRHVAIINRCSSSPNEEDTSASLKWVCRYISHEHTFSPNQPGSRCSLQLQQPNTKEKKLPSCCSERNEFVQIWLGG